MIFRFVLTWTLFAFIALCNANYQTVPAPSPNYNDDETLVLNNLIPYEKFVEGDIYEPLLYGTHTIQTSVSPFIPVNSYADSYAPDLNPSSYQVSPVSYEQSKPMPANFNVYSAKNPTPIQYKPASVYPQPANPVSYSAIPNYQAAALPNYQSPALPALSPAPYNYQPQLIDYGLHYEQNQSPVVVPTTNYPTNPMAYQQPILPQPSVYPVGVNYPAPVPSYPVASYPAAYPQLPTNPAASYPAAYPQVPTNPYSVPTVPTYEKPAMSTTKNETAPPATDPKKDEPTTPVMNEKPSVKPPPKTDVKPSVVDTKPPTPPTPKPPAPKPPTDTKPPPKKNYANKFTGYRYIMKPSVRRSLPTLDKNSAALYHQNQAANYRSLPTAPYLQTAPIYSNANPYPPSILNYDNSTKSNVVYRKSNSTQTLDKRSASKNQFRQLTARETTRHPTYVSRNVNYNANYNNQKAYYPAASTNYPSTPIYNENNVAEAVLRGYSINADENNNKAIVRLFEETHGAISFDFRICDLKKDHIYSIYIHDYGQLTAGCESSGGQYGAKDTQFNPILGIRSNPVGFIGTFKYNGENMVVQHFTRKIYLSNIIGRNIVIHEITTNTKVLPEAIENNMLNQFSVLMNPLSSPLVTSRKVACGVIGRANPYSFLRPVNPNCEIEVPVVEEKPDPLTVKRDMQNENDTKKINSKKDQILK